LNRRNRRIQTGVQLPKKTQSDRTKKQSDIFNLQTFKIENRRKAQWQLI
jgi:hypothetical protein